MNQKPNEVESDQIEGPCSFCGGKHWRPDCPGLAPKLPTESGSEVPPLQLNARLHAERCDKILRYWEGKYTDGQRVEIIESAIKIVANAELESLRRRVSIVEQCSTCNGQSHASGLECICGGKNSRDAEIDGLRKAYFDMSHRVGELEKDLAFAKKQVEAYGRSDSEKCEALRQELSTIHQQVEELRRNDAFNSN